MTDYLCGCLCLTSSTCPLCHVTLIDILHQTFALKVAVYGYAVCELVHGSNLLWGFQASGLTVVGRTMCNALGIAYAYLTASC